MKSINSFVTLITGIAIGVILVLSCSDNSPHKADAADAATCSCPSAEAPIADRIVEIANNYIVPANSMQQANSVSCPFGPVPAIVLTGGCAASVGNVPNIILEQSAPGGIGWECSWRNPSNADIPVRAVVRCLMPAK
jgi:hypothetical protein